MNERSAEDLLVSLEWQCYKESEQQLVHTFLDIPWPCAAAALRLLQMCDLCDSGLMQLPSKCPWCSAPVTVNGISLCMQLTNYTAHLKDGGSCVGMYTAVIDQWGTVLDQAVPIVKGLLSDADLRKANNYSSDYATIYISVNGHRQWPSMGQPLIHFIATLIGNAREAFIQEMMHCARSRPMPRQMPWTFPRRIGQQRSSGTRALHTPERGFEAAAAEMETAMKAVRELDIEPHNEMESGKLPDTFSASRKEWVPRKVKNRRPLWRRKSRRKRSRKKRMMRWTSMSLMRMSSLRRRRRKKKLNLRSLLSPCGLTS